MIQTPIGNSDHASVAFDINIEAEQNSKIVFTVDTPNEKYELFLAVIHHTIELFVPLKPQKTTGVQLPLHLIRCNRKKNSAWAKAVSSDNQADWDEYNKLRTTFEKRLSKFYNHVERKVIFSKNKNAFHRLLNSRLGKAKEDGIAVCKDRDKAELLADVFAKSFQKGDDSLELDAVPSFPVMEDSFGSTRKKYISY
ncbi:hypothetical protein COOONC_07501 [Cooperia oncophora]